MTFERYIGSGDFGRPYENETILLNESAANAFKAMNAQAWIDVFRVENADEEWDIEATVAAVGLPLRWSSHDENGLGLLGSGVTTLRDRRPLAITVDVDHCYGDVGFTVGHELGHVFLLTAAGTSQYLLQAEENFCDYFGEQMALPASKLEKVTHFDEPILAELVRHSRVRADRILHRLMELGTAPKQALIHSTVPDKSYNDGLVGTTRQSVACLDCYQHNEHPIDIDPDSLPFYDFSSHAWGDYFWLSRHDRQFTLGKHIDLNLRLGRWTLDVDRQFMESQEIDEQRRVKAIIELAQIAYENGDQLALF